MAGSATLTTDAYRNVADDPSTRAVTSIRPSGDASDNVVLGGFRGRMTSTFAP